MATGRLERLAPLTGVLFTVIFAVGFLGTGETPDTNASAEEILDYYDDTGKVLLGVIALGLASIALMFFAGVLRHHLRSTGPEWLASTAFGGAVIYTVGLALFASSQFALLDAADVNRPEAVQALNFIDSNNFAPSIIGLTVLLLATAWHVLTSHALPAWLGWVALVLGIVALAGPLGFLTFLLFPLWVLGVAIALFRGAGAPQATLSPE